MAKTRKSQAGLSLVEIMVGVAIGMIGIVIVFQALSVWEERKRTTSSGSDAQIAGTLGMFNIERDVRLSGYGFGTSSLMGCMVNAYDTTAGRNAYTFRLTPVEIVQGSSAPDELHVLYGSSSIFSATQAVDAPNPPPNTFTKDINTSSNMVNVNDLVLITGGASNCHLVQVTGKNANNKTINHDGGVRFNNPAGTAAIYNGGGSLNNLGAAPRRAIWQVRAAAGATNPSILAWSEDIAAPGVWNEVAEGIVDLQAEYGVDGIAGQPVDNQINASEWTTAAPGNWTKLRAVRVALLARSQQYERPVVSGGVTTHVTPSTPTWTGSATSPFVMKNLDGSAGTTTPTDPALHWQNYRYRVYEQVIPIRNMIWATSPSS